MSSRAMRRHHAERAKKRARRTIRVRWSYDPNFARDRAQDPVVVGIEVRTPCLCSRRCCGNPRRHFSEVTRQEQLAALDFDEQLEEVASDR